MVSPHHSWARQRKINAQCICTSRGVLVDIVNPWSQSRNAYFWIDSAITGKSCQIGYASIDTEFFYPSRV